jgi:hypothetical protein
MRPSLSKTKVFERLAGRRQFSEIASRNSFSIPASQMLEDRRVSSGANLKIFA